MKPFIIFGIAVLIGLQGFSQEQSLSLEKCLLQAEQQFPLLKQKGLYESIANYNIKNIQTNYLPQANINGQATWQSEVTKIPIKIPNISIPESAKDQYKLTLDVNQLIFDAGATKQQEEIEKINLALNQKGMDVELYHLRDRVSQIYYGILLLRENKEQLKITQSDIRSRLEKMESSIRNGVALGSGSAVLKAEILKIDQAIEEIHYNTDALIQSLMELTGLKVDESTKMEMPDVATNVGLADVSRPDLKILDLQQDRLLGLDKLTATKMKPKLMGFGTLGYGRPGLNMLSNNFGSYGIVGAKLSWNVWNWDQTKVERQVFGVQRSIIETQKENFNQNLRVAISGNLSEINKYKSLIETDRQIIQLRSEITKTSSSQLDNGVITPTDYLSDVNAELQARLNQKTHQVKLSQAKINYLITLGRL